MKGSSKLGRRLAKSQATRKDRPVIKQEYPDPSNKSLVGQCRDGNEVSKSSSDSAEMNKPEKGALNAETGKQESKLTRWIQRSESLSATEPELSAHKPIKSQDVGDAGTKNHFHVAKPNVEQQDDDEVSESESGSDNDSDGDKQSAPPPQQRPPTKLQRWLSKTESRADAVQSCAPDRPAAASPHAATDAPPASKPASKLDRWLAKSTQPPSAPAAAARSTPPPAPDHVLPGEIIGASFGPPTNRPNR